MSNRAVNSNSLASCTPISSMINRCGSVNALDTLYDKLYKNCDDSLLNGKCEVREGKIETGIKSERSRYYESKSVAAQHPSSQWVGWTYWYRGGKYGEPEAIDWIGDAYFLNCKEKEEVMTIRTFTKVANKPY